MTEFDFLGKYQLSHTDAHTSCTEMISKCFLFFFIKHLLHKVPVSLEDLP